MGDGARCFNKGWSQELLRLVLFKAAPAKTARHRSDKIVFLVLLVFL